MKRILTILCISIIPFTASANSNSFEENNIEIFRISSTIVACTLLMLFILGILKKILDHRLKNKIVEKGIPENIISSILESSPNDNMNLNIKWFCLLAGLGTALIIIHNTQPLGIHSLAIMSFCISASFLCYYLFLKFIEKK